MGLVQFVELNAEGKAFIVLIGKQSSASEIFLTKDEETSIVEIRLHAVGFRGYCLVDT